MNELRLQYHRETGSYPRELEQGSLLNTWIFGMDLEYTEWLEEQLEKFIKNEPN